MPYQSFNCPKNIRESSPLVWLAALLFLVFALERLTCVTPDVDLWGYMAFGRLFWETGSFPYQDVFAYLPTHNLWVYHEWLTGVLFYPIYQRAGAQGLQLLKYALGLCAVGLVYFTARLRGATPLSSILGLFLVQHFLELGYSPVRAQIFSYALFALTLYLLEGARLNGRWRALWILVPVQLLWANLHGGFLAGLGLIALYALGELFSRRPFLPYVLILLVSVLFTIINPYGLAYWTYLFAAVSMPRPEIWEWISAYQAFQDGVFLTQFLVFLLVAAFPLYIGIKTQWRELTPLLVLCVTFYLGLTHLRHQVFFYLAVGAYLPGPLTMYLQDMRANPTKFQALKTIGQRLGWQIPALLLAPVLVYYGYLIGSQNPLSFQLAASPTQGKVIIQYPTGAVAYIKTHGLSGKILTEFHWGEYLIWTLSPYCQVSLDGRFETVYPPSVCQDYFNFILARPQWRYLIEKYPPDMILIDRRSKIYTLIKNEASWKEVYQDAGSALFVHCHQSLLEHKLVEAIFPIE